MKKGYHIAFIFILIISFPLLSKISLFLYFFTNQAEIIQTKCVNKDIPESCCKGKCYLGTQLKKIEEPIQLEKNKFPISIRVKEIPAEVNDLLDILNPDIKLVDLKFIEPNYAVMQSINPPVFHPPEA